MNKKLPKWVIVSVIAVLALAGILVFGYMMSESCSVNSGVRARRYQECIRASNYNEEACSHLR